ncbi:hypothetical protein BOX15_Mlig018606g1 [Macrostomum lignano]|uniref:PLAC8 family protein n=2 Tax=Macrostomum lignano TaxID=282301 RepID=A0A1I8JKZ3_9PLAT|nr:hypothetical protein BOX15_Mlig018606g1 [Macrostomum lignano]
MNVPTKEFQHGLCGCLDDCSLCIITYFCPCYTFGRNAEAVGSSCCLCGVGLILGFGCIIGPMIRGKIRERQGIDGSFCKDWCIWLFCGFCALVQEAQEVKSFAIRAQSIERE